MAGHCWQRRAALAAVLVVLACAAPAAAHAPVFLWDGAGGDRRPVLIPDVMERSRAFYGLVGQGEVHRFRFVADAGDQVPVDLLVPAGQAAAAGAYVRLPGGGEVPLEPVQEAVFQGFTQMRLVRVARLRLTAPETGLYEIHVYPAETLASTGPGPRVKYLLAVGEREGFGLLDVFKGPLWWLEARLWLWR